MSSLPTLLNLRPPINDAVVDGKAILTPIWSSFFTNLNRTLVDLASFNPADYGATGNGIADDTKAVQSAMNAAEQAGGGIIKFDSGTFSILSVSTPKDTATGSIPIYLQGEGLTTILSRRGALPPGVGMLDINGSDVTVTDMLLEGNTLTSTGLQYGVDFNGVGGNDPMAASLTTNTTIWIHGNTAGSANGISNLNFSQLQFQHAGGYSMIADCSKGSINGLTICQCWGINNRPTLFGTTPGQLIYGSWNGGFLISGDGQTAGSGVLNHLKVVLCDFERFNGNVIWSHLYGLNALHSDFRIVANSFLDCGLDGIEIGGVTGGVVSLNTFRRIGYTTVSDTAQSVPRWLAGYNATALDSSGVVKGVNYVCNSFTSVNGGCIDLDGHCFSSLTSNVCRIPYSYEPEYVTDQIAISGMTNSGSTSYGINLNNSSQTQEGATNIEICGNQFINLSAGSMRLYAARQIQVTANNINAPANSSIVPISMGPVGAGPYQRCYSVRISGNNINYSPAAPAPSIFEDDTISNFLSTEVNYVYDNFPVSTTGLAFEFQKSTHSGAFVSSIFPPTQNYIATENGANSAIACAAGSGAKLTVGLTVQILLAHTLGAGANTFAYNGGAALAIKSHFNVANNIATGYAVGSTVSLFYDGTRWLDLSQ